MTDAIQGSTLIYDSALRAFENMPLVNIEEIAKGMKETYPIYWAASGVR